MSLSKKKHVCVIYNYAQHYRENIFVKLNECFEVDFYFGDHYRGIKKLDYELLTNVTEVKNIQIFGTNFYFQPLLTRALKDKYEVFIILGDPHCISSWIVLFYAKLKSKKSFLWTHGWYGKENTVKKILKKTFFKLASGVFLYGNYAKKLMLKQDFKESDLKVIYNSLDYDRQLTFRNSCSYNRVFQDHFNNQNKNLIFIGRLTKIKRLDMALEALDYLNAEKPCYNLTIIGEGEMKEELKAKSEKLNITKNVWFYGSSYNEQEISNMIYNADLCISPGNVGLTAMHSMMYGTPVITHDNFMFQVPEFEAIVQDETGSFFEFNNSLSLASQISSWFNRNSNRDEIRENCFRIIDKYYNPYFQIEIIKNAILK